ncbi:MAG TPA: flagellar export protein FliJ [Limnobacter sp.]|nr:flagellar export protein FliJ [Limnobacter sp.]
MSNVLQILIEQASEKADKAAKSMAVTQQKMAQARDKLNMLQTYRDECESGLQNKAVTGLTGQQLRNQLAFVGKIAEAISQQKRELDFLDTTLQHQRKQWQDALGEQRKYEALVEREKLKKARLENKRDQKMNDEFAARIYRVHTAGETT